MTEFTIDSRPGSRRKFAAVLSFCIIAGSLSACGSDGPSSRAETDAIEIAIPYEPPSLDGHTDASSNTADVYGNIYETLTAFEPDGTVSPQLAAEPPTQLSDTKWEIKIRPEVSFSDGEPLTAESVVANINRMIEVGAAGSFAEQIAGIEEATAVDDMTVNITTSSFDIVLPARLPFIYIMAPDSIEANSFDDSGVGTGPYVVKAWNKGRDMVLEANEAYWGTVPSLKTATFRFLPDAGARVAALNSGEVDVAQAIPADSESTVPKSAVSSDSGIMAVIPTCVAGFATEEEDVRRAMLEAVDRQAIAENLIGSGSVVPGDSMIGPHDFGYPADGGPTTEYDPEDAKRLIEEAGATGETVTIAYDAGRFPQSAQVVQVLQKAWSEIGLDAKLDSLTGEAYVNAIIGKGNHRDTVFVGVSSSDTFDASLAASKWMYSDSLLNSCPDPELDRTVRSAVETADIAKREELYAQAINIVHENVYSMPIATAPSQLVGLAKDVSWTPGVGAYTLAANMSIS